MGDSASRDESMDPSLERTSKRVDGYQDTPDIRIDLSVLPSFREILVHSFVRDGREQRHVGYADLFLLETFFPICLCASLPNSKRAQTMAATHLRDFVISSPWFLGRGRGLLPRLLGDSLNMGRVNGGWSSRKIITKPTIPNNKIKSRGRP